ncbi:MAG: hypothetical protein LBG58_09890 [Planctomycetaceae bacterium]|nr:hypothetical protein [Planctomycetaceae bacterium]
MEIHFAFPYDANFNHRIYTEMNLDNCKILIIHLTKSQDSNFWKAARPIALKSTVTINNTTFYKGWLVLYKENN